MLSTERIIGLHYWSGVGVEQFRIYTIHCLTTLRIETLWRRFLYIPPYISMLFLEPHNLTGLAVLKMYNFIIQKSIPVKVVISRAVNFEKNK